MATNGNGFKVAFWVMSVVCVVGLSTLASNVIANDKKNTDEHTEIRKEVHIELKEIRKEQSTISIQIAKILAGVEAIKNGN